VILAAEPVLVVAKREKGRAMPTAAEMVAEAKKRVENLTVDETARELEEDNALLVDVREPGERAENGSIPGAVSTVLENWSVSAPE